jgi:hypothetical protein
MEGSCEHIELTVADSRQGGPPALGLDEGLTTHRKKQLVTKCYTGPRNWMDCIHLDQDRD